MSGGGDFCFRVKLLVTGQANVGKTSLLAALKNEVGSVNKVLRLLTGKGRRSSTLGISLEDWRPLDQQVTFSTWDFGGQLVYYATHQFFLSKRSLYLLVFSLAAGLSSNRLLSWLNSIQVDSRCVFCLFFLFDNWTRPVLLVFQFFLLELIWTTSEYGAPLHTWLKHLRYCVEPCRVGNELLLHRIGSKLSSAMMINGFSRFRPSLEKVSSCFRRFFFVVCLKNMQAFPS